jgi:protein SCO1/2
VRALASAALALWLVACGPREDVFLGTGTVKSVDAARAQVVIAHEEISGLMPAMTMSFDVPEARFLDGVAAGAKVSFELRRTPTRMWISALHVDTPAAEGGAPGGGAALLPDQEPAPDFALVDQDGREARLSSWRGRPVLLDFVFTRCPGPCPIQTARLVEVQRKLPPEVAARVRFVSVSLDPEHDTPERLRAYAQKHGADLASWSFLTGEPARVQAVLDAYGIGTVRKADGELDHVVATYLIGPDGKVAHRYVGLETKSSVIRADLTSLAAPNT